MKRITMIIVGCVFTLFLTNQLPAQSVSQDDMMKAWQAYMTPGEFHKMLAKDEGEWAAEISSWMDPNATPTKSTGKMVNKMILGGRYQEQRYTGDFMGMPMEGIGTLAYDNAKKVFVSTWMDNMGTGIMTMEGKYDPATKTINFEGKSVDPLTGKDMKCREVFKYVDDNNQILEMYINQTGKEFKTMEIKFTRK
ncbi:DUF1579 domain-containing protein [Flavihumibacter solisilvae]|uniref:DUF1579 domain-containing protein n=1 Tax=Flavihumibacter solisilvae TaxID=1349421 RepID=A0A0C1LM60_9BACT|nr:DUF1579 domain-containing protein [Flavihumibacter solisilvae]KIC96423.1 hypothetical protein OI18_01410 [Flavihumibacter solisilvae]